VNLFFLVPILKLEIYSYLQASYCVSPEPKYVPSSQSKSSGSSDEGESKSMVGRPILSCFLLMHSIFSSHKLLPASTNLFCL